MVHSGEEERSPRSDAPTFAVDVVRRLGSQLDAIQEKHDWAVSKGDARVSTQQREPGNELPSSSSPPPSAVIDLTSCTSLHSKNQLRIALERCDVDEVVSLAKVTYAAYGIVLDQILKDAERVNNQAWFWTEIEEDVGQTIMYLVQSE
jgi:hypothetical protein